MEVANMTNDLTSWEYKYEERAGILQAEGYTKDEAERMARKMVEEEKRDAKAAKKE